MSTKNFYDLSKAILGDIPDFPDDIEEPIHLRNVAIGKAVDGKDLIIEVFAVRLADTDVGKPDFGLLFLTNAKITYTSTSYKIQMTELPINDDINYSFIVAFYGEDASSAISTRIPKIKKTSKDIDKYLVVRDLLVDEDTDNDDTIPEILEELISNKKTRPLILITAKALYPLYYTAIGDNKAASEYFSTDFMSATMEYLISGAEGNPFMMSLVLMNEITSVCGTAFALEYGDEKYLDSDNWDF